MKTYRTVVLVAAAALGASLVASAALAADASGTTVNLAPLGDLLVGAAASLLSGVVTIAALWVRHYLKTRLGIELDASTREYVQHAADRAVDLLLARLARHAAVTVDVHNRYLADAVDMLAEQVPDGLNRLGLTSDNVRQMLLTRLAAHGVLPPEDGAADAALAH